VETAYRIILDLLTINIMDKPKIRIRIKEYTIFGFPIRWIVEPIATASTVMAHLQPSSLSDSYILYIYCGISNTGAAGGDAGSLSE
jgi:hypothetical protein